MAQGNVPVRVTAPALVDRKHAARSQGHPLVESRLVMVTAYDAPSAKAAHRAGVDMILVGDSLSMVVLGYDDTLQVTTDDIAHHTGAVARGLKASAAAGCEHAKPLVVGDLPWMGYHTSTEKAVENAAQLIRAGADCVKLEGGRKRLSMVRAILDAEIPVMGHIGLTPQSVNAMGGFKVQGRQLAQAQEIIDDALALEAAGCFAIVLEGVPDALAARISELIAIPTIGIGAGAECDGQVLVWHDLLGLEDRFVPKFVRSYAKLGDAATEAVAAYAADVRSGAFPSAKESYAASAELTAWLDRPAAAVAARSREEQLSLEAEEFLAGLYGATA
jgi:3-methyl-2-oxobutanoate hydroxymethyltransferase